MIDFNDLHFEKKCLWCKQKDGIEVLKIIRFGMPRLKKDFLNCSFFLRGQKLDTKGKIIKGAVTKGTGCIVVRPSKTVLPKQHIYGVTCRHVIETMATTIRLNNFVAKKGYRDITIENKDWKTSIGLDDFAIVDLTDYIAGQNYDFAAVAENAFVTKEWIEKVELGTGEDVFMTGFYANAESEGKNNPVARFGNIARLADENVPLRQGHGLELPSHLIDMRSRTGFSGSPVFVYRTHGGDLRNPNSSDFLIDTSNNMLRLLGIHTSQFHEDITAEKAEAMGEPIREGDPLIIPSSMTIVIPAWKISEILNDPDLEEMRQERDKKWKKEAGARSMPESVPDKESSTHKEDFNRLLGEAVPKKQSKKGT